MYTEKREVCETKRTRKSKRIADVSLIGCMRKMNGQMCQKLDFNILSLSTLVILLGLHFTISLPSFFDDEHALINYLEYLCMALYSTLYLMFNSFSWKLHSLFSWNSRTMRRSVPGIVPLLNALLLTCFFSCVLVKSFCSYQKIIYARMVTDLSCLLLIFLRIPHCPEIIESISICASVIWFLCMTQLLIGLTTAIAIFYGEASISFWDRFHSQWVRGLISERMISIPLTSSMVYPPEAFSPSLLDHERVHKSPFQSALDALWFCISSLTVVGYGDLVPFSPLGRGFAIFCVLCGILCIAVGSAMLGKSFIESVRLSHDTAKEKSTLCEQNEDWCSEIIHFCDSMSDELLLTLQRSENGGWTGEAEKSLEIQQGTEAGVRQNALAEDSSLTSLSVEPESFEEIISKIENLHFIRHVIVWDERVQKVIRRAYTDAVDLSCASPRKKFLDSIHALAFPFRVQSVQNAIQISPVFLNSGEPSHSTEGVNEDRSPADPCRNYDLRMKRLCSLLRQGIQRDVEL